MWRERGAMGWLRGCHSRLGEGTAQGTTRGLRLQYRPFLTGSEGTGAHQDILVQLSVRETNCAWTRLPASVRASAFACQSPSFHPAPVRWCCSGNQPFPNLSPCGSDHISLLQAWPWAVPGSGCTYDPASAVRVSPGAVGWNF